MHDRRPFAANFIQTIEKGLYDWTCDAALRTCAFLNLSPLVNLIVVSRLYCANCENSSKIIF